MEWAGWIGRHELDVHRALLTGVGSAVFIPGADERTESLREDVRRDAEVDESRPGDLGGAHAGAREVEPLDDRRGEVARTNAQLLREHHREIRRPVAKRRIARSL